jgi:hypothetical protein
LHDHVDTLSAGGAPGTHQVDLIMQSHQRPGIGAPAGMLTDMNRDSG